MCTHRYVVPLSGVDVDAELVQSSGAVEDQEVVQVSEGDVLAVVPPQQVTTAALQAVLEAANALLSKQPER